MILESKGVLLDPEVNLDTLEKGSIQYIVPTSLDIGSRSRSQHSSETSSNWSILALGRQKTRHSLCQLDTFEEDQFDQTRQIMRTN